jgi:hypothetical protein
MKTIERRISSLEARQPKQEAPNILSKLTDSELCELERVCIKAEDWQRLDLLTAEEIDFIKGLEAKYGVTERDKAT